MDAGQQTGVGSPRQPKSSSQHQIMQEGSELQWTVLFNATNGEALRLDTAGEKNDQMHMHERKSRGVRHWETDKWRRAHMQKQRPKQNEVWNASPPPSKLVGDEQQQSPTGRLKAEPFETRKNTPRADPQRHSRRKVWKDSAVERSIQNC